MNVFVLLNTKEDILKNVGNRAVLGHQSLPLHFFFLNIFHCVQQNKDIHTGLEILEGELMMTEFSFLGELFL